MLTSFASFPEPENGKGNPMLSNPPASRREGKEQQQQQEMWKRKRKGRIHSPRRVVPNNGRPFFGRSADKMEYELHLATKLRRPSVSAVCHKDPHTRLYTVCVCVCLYIYSALFICSGCYVRGLTGCCHASIENFKPYFGFQSRFRLDKCGSMGNYK